MRLPTTVELKLLPLFSGMTNEELENVARLAIVKDYAAGSQIFFEGMESNVLHVIMSGTIEIFKKTYDEEVVLNVLRRGEYLGEVSFADNLKRSASARAKEDATVIVLTRDSFNKLMNQSLSATNKLLLHFCKVLAQRLRRAEQREFQSRLL